MNVSKNKELADYIVDQLSDLGDIRNIPMMGGYIFYYKEKIFGGIYGNGFLVKNTCQTVSQSHRMKGQRRCFQ